MCYIFSPSDLARVSQKSNAALFVNWQLIHASNNNWNMEWMNHMGDDLYLCKDTSVTVKVNCNFIDPIKKILVRH